MISSSLIGLFSMYIFTFSLLSTIVLSSVVNLQITVTDINDNPPEFSSLVFRTSVLEIVPIGASIIEVTIFKLLLVVPVQALKVKYK